MIQHKWSRDHTYQILRIIEGGKGNHYGVSYKPKILTPGLFFKHHDRVMVFLRDTLRLSPRQCEITEQLLRFYIFYSSVYPSQKDCSGRHRGTKPTFWRTISKLEEMGMIVRIPRYFVREKAQTSNLYEMEKLLILLARYIREHGAALADNCIKLIIDLGGAEFWSWAFNRKYSEVLPAMGAP